MKKIAALGLASGSRWVSPHQARYSSTDLSWAATLITIRAASSFKNIRLVLEEKTRKVAKYRPRYAIWWLALVDKIGYARLDADETQALREHIKLSKAWDKLLLIDPLEPKHCLEI